MALRRCEHFQQDRGSDRAGTSSIEAPHTSLHAHASAPPPPDAHALHPNRLVDLIKSIPRRAAELLTVLRELGFAGVLSYLIINTIYYTIALSVAFYSIYLIRGEAKSLLEVLVGVWAGSTVTEPARLGLTLALAPFVSRELNKLDGYHEFERGLAERWHELERSVLAAVGRPAAAAAPAPAAEAPAAPADEPDLD
eukprot:tig00000157_g9621.t1